MTSADVLTSVLSETGLPLLLRHLLTLGSEVPHLDTLVLPGQKWEVNEGRSGTNWLVCGPGSRPLAGRGHACPASS